MIDEGINKGLVQKFNTSGYNANPAGVFYGFRKMFWKYLKKLHVPFYDPCCPAASDGGSNFSATRFNTTTGVTEYWNGTAWVNVTSWTAPTTTTTSTAATTTLAPTTTTTTVPSDIRLKSNIQLTGNKIGSLREYSWNWNQEAKDLNLAMYPTTGVLAQEALVIYPQFVSVDAIDGYYRVNLDGIAKA